MKRVTGTSRPDLLVGTTGADTIRTGDGNDIILAKGGDDKLDGGAGDDVIDGGDGNDILTDTSGANTFKGGAGNDMISGCGTFQGGTGDDVINSSYYYSGDTYVFNLGDGKDIIADYGGSAATGYSIASNDTLTFGTGINSSQLWFRKVGNDLDVTRIGSTEGVVIKDWYSSGFQHVEQFKAADGKMLLDSQVDALVSAMAAFAPPAAGQTTLPVGYQTALNPVIAANWE